MSVLTCNGHPVVQAEICLPRVGVGDALLMVDSAEEISGVVTLATDDGSFALTGHAERDLVYLEGLRLRFVCGVGDLSQTLPPKAYGGYTLRSILVDLMQSTGSTLSDSVDSQLLSIWLERWARLGGRSAKSELQSLLSHAGAESWRVLPDGTIWTTLSEPWPSAPVVDFDVAARNAEENWVTLDCERPFALPGQTLLLPSESVGSGSPEQRISAVVHVVQAGLVQSRLYVEDAA